MPLASNFSSPDGGKFAPPFFFAPRGFRSFPAGGLSARIGR